ncbi:membrane protein YdbS with pleckstrin-like domain [Evansella vedderi]|uniref:Membrane protein YdbS with pleckstrin-like domain n=1 Tax=Evansella vedderi TaxID=38282 RepID=A0ABT9ZVH5_9BACI|nr:PH domain-containing protein [Evansella vedderi]MDQ0255239.1 membrane protein YdbS with pleckstrin-like domain [Evansella vedderi]
MREKPNNPLALKTLKVWRITATMECFFFLLIPIVYVIAGRYVELPQWPIYVLVIVVFIIGYFKITLFPKLQWKKWRYKIYENEVELMYGVFVVRRVIIPMIRVQHVDTRQGPILRHYGLSSVTISTAATIHEIPGLEEVKADELRDHIAELAREADPNE